MQSCMRSPACLPWPRSSLAASRADGIAAPLAYVSNEGSAHRSVIDTATDKVTATLKVGGKPRGIALSPTARGCTSATRPPMR